MLVKVFGGAVYGINAITITIEVNILWGAKFIIVGLPDNAVKESQERIDSALREIGSKIPGKRVVINMAPADVKKEGSSYDLPLAIGILAANEQLPAAALERYVVMGELSLDGSLQPVKGVLPIAINAKREGFKGILLPLQNANEASVVQDFEVYGFRNLGEVVAFLRGELAMEPARFEAP
ncbi:MAG: magnesium chelatase, partial [Odoribacteraceae bacterium]|nr:magnesium chelatase [Odoribacteraceae bacterium]